MYRKPEGLKHPRGHSPGTDEERSPLPLVKKRGGLSYAAKDLKSKVNVFFGFGGHLSCVQGSVLKNPSVSFFPNVPHCINHHSIEVSSSLPWDCGSRFLPPSMNSVGWTCGWISCTSKCSQVSTRFQISLARGHNKHR